MTSRPATIEEFLRPYLDEEEVEATAGEDRASTAWSGAKRSTVPAEPRRQVVDAERHQHHQPLELPETALRALWKDLLACGVEWLAGFGGVDRRNLEPLHLPLVEHSRLLLDAKPLLRQRLISLLP
jgi:hypothetical protein